MNQVALLIFSSALNTGSDFGYIGCYADTITRALRYNPIDSNNYDIKSCFIACYDYQYFALQNGSHCFCEDDFDHCTKYGESTNCQNNMGGNWANSLYVAMSSVATLSQQEGSNNEHNHARKLQQIQQTNSTTANVTIPCTYSNSATIDITPNQLLGGIKIKNIMELSFDLQINQPVSCPANAYCHIFAIGRRLPLIFTKPTQLFTAQFSTNDKYNHGYTADDGYEIITDGNWHSLYFKFTFSERIISIDGIHYININNGTFDFNDYVNNTDDITTVWISSSGNLHNGTIRNICIQSAYTTANPTSSPTSSPTSTTSSPTVAPTLAPFSTDFEYIGCYADNITRALQYGPIHVINIKSCFMECWYYKYFALQNGSQCFCDNEFDRSTMYGESTNCENNTGGNLANSLYVTLLSLPSVCTSISYADKTCYFDEYIENIQGEALTETIICHPNYPNCIINSVDWSAYYIKEIHCPSTICSTCIINDNTAHHIDSNHMEGITIYGYNCELLQINADGIADCIIYAPGNDGSLVIIPYDEDSFLRNNIYSSNNGPGTANMIFDFAGHNSKVSNNYIDGMYVTGDLNFSCSAEEGCFNTSIKCGIHTQCNINCSVIITYGDISLGGLGCSNMNVYAVNTSAVDWYCQSDLLAACVDSQLSCVDPDNSSYSKWEWDSLNGWYYSSPDCVENWTGLPPLSCQFTTSDTCIIVRDTSPEYRQDLVCDTQYTLCQIQIKSSGPAGSIINCPSETCDSCNIYCDEDHACDDAIIMGYNCTLLDIIIRSGGDINMQIWAPGNDGELFMDVPYDQNAGNDGLWGIRNSDIYSVPGTKNMIFNFNECVYCIYNRINGAYTTNDMNVSCGGFGDCEGIDIICPNDANCNIDCTSNWGGCFGGTINAMEGTHDVDLICNDNDEYCCDGLILECDIGESMRMYNRNESQWYWDDLTCYDPPSEAPTAAPTFPSISPTEAPSLSPTPIPTEPSSAPTVPPTQSPTSAPTSPPLKFHEKIGIENEASYYAIIIGSIIAFLVFLCGLICCIYYYKYKKPFLEREAKAICISNACVLLVAIGEYDDEIEDGVYDIDGHLRNLVGIEYDIKNMQQLFHAKLNYDVFSAMSDRPDTRWTEKELKSFLEDRANYLEDNIKTGKHYDGLVVIISCHGIAGYLCTSDYKKYAKIAVHRTFSLGHSRSREIPRFILYDCCSGDNERERQDSDSEEPNEEEKETGKNPAYYDDDEIGKNTTERDIVGSRRQPWTVGQQNPDYMLARVEAANQGFQSKLDSTFGSHVIYKFYKKYMENLEKSQGKFIHEVFDEIQNELHSAGKQHPEYVWNDGTGYIIFKRNEKEDVVELEMTIKNLNNKGQILSEDEKEKYSLV